tara:strand:+ start:3487 stop:4092 length:606 start_codon:yes stop_codon:yes gene_type:complete
MKVKNVIDEVLLEKKVKNLKLFYKTDIFVQEFPNKEEDEEKPVTTPEEKQSAETEQPAESTEEDENLLTEEIHKFKSEGELAIPEEDAGNIQTMEDLLDYLSDKKSDNGQAILDDFAIEVALALSGVGVKAIEDIISKGDKLLIDVDYGTEKEDSIGFKILKNAGSNTVSITMKKDGKIIPSPFELPVFNRQLIYFRNTIV